MDFYAHSIPGRPESDWQRLSAHLNAVGDGAACRARWFGGGNLAKAGGQLHDLGKFTLPFQGRLRGEVPRLDHATWGAKVACDRYGPFGMLLAYGIAGHHAGLANGQLDGVRRSLHGRLSKDYLDTLPLLQKQWQSEVALPAQLGIPEGFKGHQDQKQHMFQFSVLARMLFSCLVDADYIDTDNFYRAHEGRDLREQHPVPALSELRERLDAHLAGKPAGGDVNRARAEVLAHVRAKAAADAPGLFSLTVPTGGGKTLASLACALDHAIRNDLRRVIYVIPFTSIVEQTARVFREAFGELGREEVVLEHHSAFLEPERARTIADSDAEDGPRLRRLAMENWDAPIVVTTAVQFFESLHGDRPSQCRKLHNIAGSVVILDEAQTLPLDLLRPCMAMIEELARNYRTSLVLCTATQPALTLEQGFDGGLSGVRELAPQPQALYERLRRVRVRHVGVMADDRLADALREREQVLCIVNNRRHARALYDAIAGEEGARHLTTLMHARHRSAVLAEIRERLQAGLPCRVISTSLIEAGVDVDFPAVLRAEAGLDSIAQAAGRCNREGRRSVDDSEVLVFSAPDWPMPAELKLFAEAFRSIERSHRDDLLSLQAVTAYFRELYFRKDRKLGEDYMAHLVRARLESLPLETLAAQFRIIRTTLRPVIVPFMPGVRDPVPEVDRAVSDLAYTVSAARRLQPYLVQVPQQAYDILWQAHAIEPIAPDKYGEQFVQLVNRRLYDPRFGLHWDEPQLLPVEDCVLT